MSKKQKSKARKDSILHRDIKDLHLLRSLRRLANRRVSEWELRDLPNLKVTEWELRDLPNVKLTDWELSDIANYRVTDWELSSLLGRRRKRIAPAPPSPKQMEMLGESLTRFIRFVTKNLADDHAQAEIRVTHTGPGSLEIQVILSRRDAAAIIGHGGHTAEAIRNVVKAVSREKRARVRLSILTKEEAALRFT